MAYDWKKEFLSFFDKHDNIPNYVLFDAIKDAIYKHEYINEGDGLCNPNWNKIL